MTKEAETENGMDAILSGMEEPTAPAPEPTQEAAVEATTEEAPAPTKELPEPTKKDAAAPTTAAKPEVKPPDDPMVTLEDGRQMPLSEFKKVAMTWREQASTNHRLLDEERRKQQEAARPSGEQPPPKQRTRDEIREQYAPIAHAAVKAGIISPEEFEENPGMVTEFLRFYGEEFGPLVRDMNRVLPELVRDFNERRRGTEQQAIQSTIDETLGRMEEAIVAMSEESAFFADLKQPEPVKAFVSHLLSLQVPVKQLTPEFIRQQYFAFRGDVINGIVSDRVKSEVAAAEASRTHAAGAGSGVRPGATPTRTGTGWENFLDEGPPTS